MFPSIDISLIGKLDYRVSGPSYLNRNSKMGAVSTVDGTILTSNIEQGLYNAEELAAQFRIGGKRGKNENNF
jgi:hypothetical protein